MPRLLLQAATRIRKNASYFRVNYLIVIVATCAITFLMHPTSLFVLAALLAGWLYLFFVRTTPLVINGRTFRWGGWGGGAIRYCGGVCWGACACVQGPS